MNISQRIIRADERHLQDFGWLQTYWLFSFGDYHDPSNIHFGPLRVFNDDIVAPGKGFDPHPHREMEIVTIVLDGAVTHEDSIGNRTTIPAGDIQRMSAGTGIVHSEYNREAVPLALYQVWFLPRTKRAAPSYAQAKIERERAQNGLLTLVSGYGDGVLAIDSDASLKIGILEKGKNLRVDPPPGGKTFLYLRSGAIQVGADIISAGDQFRREADSYLDCTALEDSEGIFILM